MPPPQLTPDSDRSDTCTIYEKINDDPPSPGSSSESTTGADAPLIQHKWKLSTLKVGTNSNILFVCFFCLSVPKYENNVCAIPPTPIQGL